MLAGRVRTYAPRGQTPILRVPLTHDHLSVIAGITPQGRLLVQMQPQAFTGRTVVGFLRHLLRQISGGVLVLWDGATIHHDRNVQGFLAGGGAARVQLVALPAYAPEVNPTEGIWQYLKHVELGNVICHDQRELRDQLRLAIARLRHKPEVIRGCIQHAGY